ncbi:flagellar basal body P-ring protein [Anatilimnocola aggregata]|uniref:Flagellar basal body P-ring protein n=1 Tax=Anatilimnocola aggregata TaxID=2528021 RepID=A0A517YG57_9BACT|nr:flagellar basal body P-ring protein FlgI [Anatilimnocola aggregata]QDU29172.1 flagellar basal body P-ring protein [Anatilimnocola aggregata]
MTPHTARQSLYNRRAFLAASLGSLGLGAISGCANPLFRGQSPEVDLPVEEIKERKLVGDFTRPWGLNWIKVESVALVTGLDNTGSDPPPSEQRRLLIAEMQSHEVPNADKILASPATSMVIVRGYLPPGVQKGDAFDIEVRTPKNSETTSLYGGWLMQTRLRRMEVLGGVIRTGDVDGIGRGNVLINGVITGENDKVSKARGRVLGGGLALESRPLGLMLRREDASIRISTLIGKAINTRFNTMDHGQKKGVAKPMRDNFLELVVSSRYKHNLGRYLRVVRNIVLQESALEKTERLQTLGRKIQEPSAAPLAALQLEAIGREGVDTLKAGLTNSDPEVRFYAAEALAYLDEADAAAPLELAARESSAFRWHALTALASMNQPTAYDALSNLLHAPSMETRYGAFRALRLYNAADPATKGELLEGKFYYHLVSTTAEPLVHVTRSKHPEVVLFGHEQAIKPPQFLNCGKAILVKGQADGQIKVCCFKPSLPTGESQDVTEYCPPLLDQLIRTVVRMGASYADVVSMLKEAQKQNLLTARFAVEALPEPGRKYYRDAHDPTDQPPAEMVAEGDETATSVSNTGVATPEPELYIDRLSQDTESDREESVDQTYIAPEYLKKQPGVLDKLNPFSGK